MAKKNNSSNLNQNLAQLALIAGWFESREDIDVEEGLKKIKEAAALIISSKERLKEVENEFKEIKRSIDAEIGESDKNAGNIE